MYHNQPQGSPNPNAPPRKDDPTRWRPPVAGSPAGYQQGDSPYTHTHTQAGAPPPQYGSPAQPPPPMQQEGYFPAQPTPLIDQAGTFPHDPHANMLATQMGTMALGGGDAPAPDHRRKKKDRHAYHNIEGPGANEQMVNGGQGMGMGMASPYSPHVGGPQWQEPEITPAMSQFPAAMPLFTPGSVASPMQHAARAHTPQPGTAVQGSAQGKVDPEQIPSIPKSRDAPANYYLEHVYPTMEHHIPPPATVPFVAFDQGNSSPKFARLTLNNIPVSADALSATALPLGLILQPLAPLQEGETPIPVLDFGETGPPRCRRCRAYINPFMQFKAGGNKMECNMCTFPNDVPGEYFAPTDASGVRVDRQQRPELMLGTVDYVVPKEYWGQKEPVGLRYLFVIDVTGESVERGFLEAFCAGILQALYGDAAEESEESEGTGSVVKIPKGAKVGIVSYDKEMHFYNLSPKLTTAQMMVMPDLEEPFLPFTEGLFVDPLESKNAITSLLTALPNMFRETHHRESALLPTLSSAVAALTATGGKVICSLGALPTYGPGKLFMRDDGNVHNTDAERKLLKTEHPGYTSVAKKMVENGIGCDFFLAAPSGGYLDIATIGTCYIITSTPLILTTQAMCPPPPAAKPTTTPTSTPPATTSNSLRSSSTP